MQLNSGADPLCCGCSQDWEEGLVLESLHLGAQGCHHQHEGPQMVWVPKET